ncbi:MAG: hypothetical protein J6Y62_01805 [Clostridia bacterium]|nr:hypothetical protein [Clostridia bacterium]
MVEWTEPRNGTIKSAWRHDLNDGRVLFCYEKDEEEFGGRCFHFFTNRSWPGLTCLTGDMGAAVRAAVKNWRSALGEDDDLFVRLPEDMRLAMAECNGPRVEVTTKYFNRTAMYELWTARCVFGKADPVSFVKDAVINDENVKIMEDLRVSCSRFNGKLRMHIGLIGRPSVKALEFADYEAAFAAHKLEAFLKTHVKGTDDIRPLTEWKKSI